MRLQSNSKVGIKTLWNLTSPLESLHSMSVAKTFGLAQTAISRWVYTEATAPGKGHSALDFVY
jgi:hypothetical protein